MAKAKKATLRKPMLSTAAVVNFAEGRTGPARSRARAAPKTTASVSGASDSSRFPPHGDVRLTVNLRADLHMKLKIDAAQRYTTIGQIIEDLVQAQYGK